MRLISTKNSQVVSISEDEIPPYAILSHTWDEDEVTLQDMQGFGSKLLSTASRMNLLKAKQGLRKVLDAVKLAASHGYDWIWIDTCCIDKTSSAELSEAINSMYRWYQNSEVCYVYLGDATAERMALWNSGDDGVIRSSRWITRGWTLQELIAPQTVLIYSKDWSLIGNSHDERLSGYLAHETGIDIGVLSGDIATHEVSVASRMRWASKRKTRRQEDMAYCLMGLFGVNMPLLYGEGAARSFIRLQTEIIQATDDQTIFAWSAPPWEDDDGRATGLLAESPIYFREAPNMYPMSAWYHSESSIPWSMTNRGLMVQLHLRPSNPDSRTNEDSKDEFLAILDCTAELKLGIRDGVELRREFSPAILLRRLWGDQYARLHTDRSQYVAMHDRSGCQIKTLFVKQDQSVSLPSFTVAETLLRGTGAFIVSGVYPRDLWDSKSGTFRSGLSRLQCIQGIFRFSYSNRGGRSEGLFDVAVALCPSMRRGQFDAVGILGPREGKTLRQAYDQLNKAWVLASQSEKAGLAQEYRDRMIPTLYLGKIQRHGGVSYVLDLLERAELEHVPLNPSSNAALSASLTSFNLSEAFTKLEGRLNTLLKPIWATETAFLYRSSKADSRVRVSSLYDPFRALHDLEVPWKWALTLSDMFKLFTMKANSVVGPGLYQKSGEGANDSFTRQELKSLHHELRVAKRRRTGAPSFEFDLKQTNITLDPTRSDKQSYTQVSEDLGLVDTKTMELDRYSTTMSIGRDFPIDAETTTGHTAVHFACILGNATSLLEILTNAKAETSKDLSIIRKQLGAVKGTQDTALHLAAAYCTKWEFRCIVTALFQAADSQEPEIDAENDHEWSYLFRLQNGNGETVLHRAAAMSNTGVVIYICQRAPDSVSRLDSLNRSILWHAACGGDNRSIPVIYKALNSTPWAPTVDYPDDNGLTPLHVACREGYADCVEALLDIGASPLCATQSPGLTPIHYASLFGHYNCLAAMAEHSQAQASFKKVVMIEEGTDLIPPIHLAAANGWDKCVRLLVDQGSPLTPLASVMCTARASPWQSTPTLVSQSNTEPTQETEVQADVQTEVEVQRIQMSTPKEVAAKRGWDTTVQYFDAIEKSHGGSLSFKQYLDV